MAILTNLPNELLLLIIADVSPMFLDVFLLSCKRIYRLGADAAREHRLVKNSLTCLSPCDLLKRVLSDASTALYPTSIELESRCRAFYWHATVPPFDAQLFKELFKNSYEPYDPYRRQDVAVPLLFTLLINLRKMRITVGYSPWLIEIVAKLVEANHEPSFPIQEPLALGRLTEVVIRPCSSRNLFLLEEKDPAKGVMKLSSLFAMMPRMRKLKVFVRDHYPYISTSPHHFGGVTELSVSGFVDSTFLEDLIGRTWSLEKFTYHHKFRGTTPPQATFAPRRVAQFVEQMSGDTLLYLDLIVRSYGHNGSKPKRLRQYHKDLFIGSLQGLTVLKTLRASIDLFTTRHRKGRRNKRTVQSLMSILPPSLETLVLDEGLEVWKADTMDILFEGIAEWKELEMANLKLVNVARCPDLEEMLSSPTQVECQMAGVKLGYSTDCGATEECNGIFEDCGDWETRPWIKESVCCEMI